MKSANSTNGAKKSEEARSSTLRRILRRRKLATIRKAIVASTLGVATLVAYYYASRSPGLEPEQPERVATREEQPEATHGAAASTVLRDTPRDEPPAPSLPIGGAGKMLLWNGKHMF